MIYIRLAAHSDFAASSTSCAWPVTGTLGRTCAIWPPGPIRKVARTVPMNFRPYHVFAATAIGFEHPWASSDADGMVRGGKRALLPPGKGSPRFAAFAEPPETARKAGFLAKCLPFDAFRSEFFG